VVPLELVVNNESAQVPLEARRAHVPPLRAMVGGQPNDNNITGKSTGRGIAVECLPLTCEGWANL
jgi:hypothetical protein